MKEFTIIVDGKEVNYSSEKSTALVNTLKEINNCYVGDILGHNVHPCEYYGTREIRELASLLGADLDEIDEDWDEKFWLDENDYL